MAFKACSCVSLVFLVALVPALHSQVAPAVEPSEGAPTQSSTLHPQFQNKDLGLDLPLHSAPKETVSVRFVVRHRSALNGQTVRVRGVIAAAILGDAACPSNRGMCMQSSIILADCKRGDHRLTSSVRVLVPEDTDPRDYDSPSALHVFSGEAKYSTATEKVWDQPADFYCPVIASLVTGGSHLLCAMLESAVRDAGGHIAAMDTDSAMIVSTKDGGVVPCAGGTRRLKDYRVPSGHAAIRALSWAEVDRIRERFEPLNPWRDAPKAPFLKLENENFVSDGERHQLYAYCVSAKLYCLFNLAEDRLLVRKPSGHGLGFLQAPYSIEEWQRRTGRKWTEDLPPWIFEAWHLILSRELGLRHVLPRWLKQPAVMAVPITTPQDLERLGCFKDQLRPFTVVTVPFPKKEIGQLWKGCFIMPYTEKLDDLHGRPMINVVSGGTFYIQDKNSSTLPKPSGWLSLKTMEDEINHLLFRAESKFCTPNGGTCTNKTIGLLVRRHIVAGEFHYVGKEASTRWASGPDLSMMTEAGSLDPADETFREYERVVDAKYLDEIRADAKHFSTKLLSRRSGAAECAIRSFKNGKNIIRPRTLRKLTKAIHDLQNKKLESLCLTVNA